MAMLLLFVPANLFGLVGANQPVLLSIHRLQRLLLILVTDLPELLFAVLGVDVLLSDFLCLLLLFILWKLGDNTLWELGCRFP